MEIWIGIHSNHFQRILLFQRCLEKSGLQINLDQECEILTNIYKCFQGGRIPRFVEDDIFHKAIPLNGEATLKSGPKVSDQDGSG